MGTKWITVKLPEELIERLDNMLNSEYIKKKGYTSRVDLLREAINDLEEKVSKTGFEHFNTYEDRVRIIDYTRHPKRIIDIFIRKEKGNNIKLYCEYCEAFNCTHVQFAKGLEEVQKIMKGEK